MSDFKQMRGIPDKKLHEALTNHAGVLVQILGYIKFQQKTRWRQQALNTVLSLGLLYSLFQATIDGVLVQVGTLTHYIMRLF